MNNNASVTEEAVGRERLTTTITPHTMAQLRLHATVSSRSIGEVVDDLVSQHLPMLTVTVADPAPDTPAAA